MKSSLAARAGADTLEIMTDDEELINQIVILSMCCRYLFWKGVDPNWVRQAWHGVRIDACFIAIATGAAHQGLHA